LGNVLCCWPRIEEATNILWFAWQHFWLSWAKRTSDALRPSPSDSWLHGRLGIAFNVRSCRTRSGSQRVITVRPTHRQCVTALVSQATQSRKSRTDATTHAHGDPSERLLAHKTNAALFSPAVGLPTVPMEEPPKRSHHPDLRHRVHQPVGPTAAAEMVRSSRCDRQGVYRGTRTRALPHAAQGRFEAL